MAKVVPPAPVTFTTLTTASTLATAPTLATTALALAAAALALALTLALAATALLAASAAALALTQNSRTARLACSQVKWADHADPDYFYLWWLLDPQALKNHHT